MNFRYKILLIVINCLLLHLLNAQDFQKVDSLKTLLEKSSGIEKANLLKQIGDDYQQDEYHQKAITYYQKSLNICSEYKDTLLVASVLKKIGTSYYFLCNYDKALENYLKALKLYEQINDQNYILETLNYVGSTYLGCYNYNKALEYYLKSYKISERTGNKKGLYNVLNNIGIIYLLNIKDYDKALEYFYKSLLLIKENNDTSKISAPIQNIAIVYHKMQKYDTALYYFFESLKLKEKFNNKLGIARITSNIAKLYVDINNLSSAKEYLDRSLKISKEIDAKVIIKNNYYQYSLFYALKGDLNNMRIYNALYSTISDTIINEQNSRLIAEMQTKYETEKKEQQIEILNIENKLKETQLQARTYWMLIFFIAFILVVIFVVILFIQKRRLLFANTNLVQKNLEIVKSEKKLTDTNAKYNIIDNEGEKTLNQNFTIKYAGSILTDKHKIEIKNSIIHYMNSNKNYLNVDFSINTLAKDLGISRSYISQVINELFKQNFRNFLNEYRIKEARKILSSPNNLKYTIESIAELVGYKSKSTFNKTFKKYVGVTPSFYLDSMKNRSSNR